MMTSPTSGLNLAFRFGSHSWLAVLAAMVLSPGLALGGGKRSGKPNVIYFQDYEDYADGGPLAGKPFKWVRKWPEKGVLVYDPMHSISQEKHVLGKASACLTAEKQRGKSRRHYPNDMLFYDNMPFRSRDAKYPQNVTWKEVYIRYYMYLSKDFDLPDVADGYWAAPKCLGLKKGEGRALHFFFDYKNPCPTLSYLAKAGKGFRIVILALENPPPNKEEWLARLTPKRKRELEENFPILSPKYTRKDWLVLEGKKYCGHPWNPNFLWVYGAKDGEREPVLWRERWHCVELHTKAATAPGKKNGVCELWIDGKNIFSRKDLDNDQSTLENAVLRASSTSDHDRPPTGCKMYVDNVMIDTGAYIGPIGERRDLRKREAAAAKSLKRLKR